MKKLNSNPRAAEAADTAIRLTMLYKEQPSALQGDTSLKGVFIELESESEALTEAIKSDRAVSALEAADIKRDDELRRIGSLLGGYSVISLEAMRLAGLRVKAVFDKYGIETARENYTEESGHIEALLKDFSAPELAADLTALTGMTEAVAALKAAQEDFNTKRIAYEAAMATQVKQIKPLPLKRSIVRLINGTLVPYLEAMSKIDETKYGHFAESVSQAIDDTNSAIAERKKPVSVAPAPVAPPTQP